jgi:predicted helicase
LTNTLEEAARKSEQLFAARAAEEADAAAECKRAKPIVAVLGNPPYANFGRMNRGKWILSLLHDYKRGLKERKINLDDDFIKFMRFAQWRVERTGEGIVGLITNNTYLDGLTHRRMRECLMNAFSEIYLLDLHGNLRKKEKAPGGGKDQNVFDIQQGVAIGLFVKRRDFSGCRVFHCDLWGLRDSKCRALWDGDVSQTRWKALQPRAPHFFFVPREDSLGRLRPEFEQGWKLSELSAGISGIETKRDHFAIDADLTVLRRRIRDFVEGDYCDAERKRRFGVSDNEWVVEDAVAALRKDPTWEDRFVPCLCRPFDRRWVVYSPIILARDRGRLMAAMTKANIGLVAARQSKEPFAVLASDCVCTHKIVTVYDRSFVFPLYVYPDRENAEGRLIDRGEPEPNFSPAFLKALAEKLKLPQEGRHGLPRRVAPEDVFHYAYAVFYSPTYRTRYAELLKTDFPRLPLTGNVQLFGALAAKGGELVALHLLESPKTVEFLTRWPVRGENLVERVQYAEKDGRVSINKTQYFAGVPRAVWDFRIGGYQVSQKWLKDRKGRKLSDDDTQHYQKIVVALQETIRLMGEIDEVVGRHGGWPIQ